MEKNNYLSNLPRKKDIYNFVLKQSIINYVLEGLIKYNYNTDNQVLRKFKDDFTSIMINKIDYGYDLNKYFDTRNTFVQMPENLIISLYDELIDLLSKEDKENIMIMENLTKIYDFPFLSKRIKTDDGYTVKTRDIKHSDIYQAIITISRKMESFIMRYVKDIMSSEMNDDELKILREMLKESDISSCYTKYDKEFLIFKDCGVPVFEKLYNLYYKELHHKLITRVDKEINKLGFIEQKNKESEHSSYLRDSKTKIITDKKRNNWNRY